MAGYNPRCDNCFKCMTCRGNGVVDAPTSGQGGDGRYRHWMERKTCPTCRGVGGRPGAGKHDHR
jgi:hypothetical protein